MRRQLTPQIQPRAPRGHADADAVRSRTPRRGPQSASRPCLPHPSRRARGRGACKLRSLAGSLRFGIISNGHTDEPKGSHRPFVLQPARSARRPRPRRCALFPPCPRARARIPACPARRTDGTWARAGNQRSGGRRRMRRAAHRIASRRTGVRRDHARAGPGPREARADVAGRHSLKKIKIKRKGKARGEPSQEEKRTGRLPPRARGSTRASGYNE